MPESGNVRDTAGAFGMLLQTSEPELHGDLVAVTQDPAFQDAWRTFDTKKFAASFNTFNDHVIKYNAFHARERQMWAMKISGGGIPSGVDNDFRRSIAGGLAEYRAAFGAMDSCLTLVAQSKMGEIANRHVDKFLALHTFNAAGTFGKAADDYLGKIGVTAAMKEEFRVNFSKAGFRLVGSVAGGDLNRLHEVTKQGVEAQASILTYTEQHGFDYLRGKCGPPAWAILVSEILAAVGISIAAWVVVAIIVTLVLILVGICAAKILPPSLQNDCVYLAAIGIIIFAF
jgi:hypothetical protein